MTARSRRRHEEMEEKVLQHSDAVIVVGKSMGDEFKNKASRVKVITNGYDTNPERVELSKDEQFTLVHLGMMNADRNPKALWKVVQELLSENKIPANDLKIRLIGKCSGEVRKSVEQHQLQEVVEFVPYLSHDQVHEKQEKARVLLLCVNRVPSAASIITGKVFEYLQTGNPILAIGQKGGDLDALLREVGAGNAVDFDDEESLKKRVLKLYERYRMGEGQKENRNIEKYHRRNLTGELVDLIREVMES
jgi:glycosyltransferase involved in cell wall biosynthesis